MKAVIKCAPGVGHVEYIETQEPVPSPDQVKLEISTCGICGTDLHVYHDTFRNFPPVILGHEFVGRVIEEGSLVKGTTDLTKRYAVLGAVAVVCGKCRYCQSEDFMFCPDRRGMGHGVNGAFARYACVRPDQLYALDEKLPEEFGALVEPMAVAVHTVCEIAQVYPGEVALVSGPGPIGLLCALVLNHHGVRTMVAGVSRDAQRLQLIKDHGASRVIDVESEDLAEIIKLETNRLGVDIAFEVSGVAASARSCLQSIRPLGQYIQIGHFGRDIQMPFDLIGFKQLRASGSIGYTRKTWERSMRLLEDGFDPTVIVTHRMPLSQWQEAFRLFEEKKATKVLLYPETEA
ncbi:MAG: alcohol dehydrogenase catalytic domain-containing protein [Verrucomicrobiae bacterium]|nr:alcohol dehydrogenase catalytic domain-containing protein [Verrucomicrobiae bacterium]